MQAVAVIERIEKALAKTQVAAAKGIAPVNRLLTFGYRNGADVDTVDDERARAHAAVKQRHGQ
ncbi:hypothetical protein D3C79_985330 [compost metagenome]